TLLNDPSYVEAARSFAIRILKNGGADDRARIQWAFRQAISRSPNEMEMTVVQKLIEKHLTNYRELPEEAEKVVRVEGSTLPMDLKAIEVATWTSVARLLLNLHETITRM
ncbi:MAG: DUF1553 domain-containing protein, partial [Planctomycetes bacterium]|nr:DUF1553 domain-containing protein [Planctomycetota bacterium]